MYKILTLNNISTKGIEVFPKKKYEVSSEVTHPDAILLRSFKMHDYEIPPTLKAVGRAGAGVNNIPVEKLSEMGIPVFNTPGANSNAVAELVLAGMLIASRNICQGWDFSKNLKGTDEEISKAVESGKKNFVGMELPGKTLGVVGLGAIGVKVANNAISLGMNVIGYDPVLTVDRALELSPSIKKTSSIDELLNNSDFVTFHIPFNNETKDTLNEVRLRRMKDNVVILNFAREGIVNVDAVSAGLSSGKVYAYISDFPNNKLKNAPRAICLPHLGASTEEAEENCAVMVATEIKDFLENGNIKNSVNFADVFMQRTTPYRLSIANSNVPNMVGQISTELGKSNINIIDMLNRSRKEYAYTLVDIEQEVSTEAMDSIRKIKGVLAVNLYK